MLTAYKVHYFTGASVLHGAYPGFWKGVAISLDINDNTELCENDL